MFVVLLIKVNGSLMIELVFNCMVRYNFDLLKCIDRLMDFELMFWGNMIVYVYEIFRVIGFI